VIKLDDGKEVAARAVLLATGAEYRRLPVEGSSSTRSQHLLRRRATRGQICAAQRVAVVGGGNSAGQAPCGSRGAAPWSPCFTPRRLARDDVAYLIEELNRYGVAMRDRSEIAELHGQEATCAA